MCSASYKPTAEASDYVLYKDVAQRLVSFARARIPHLRQGGMEDVGPPIRLTKNPVMNYLSSKMTVKWREICRRCFSPAHSAQGFRILLAFYFVINKWNLFVIYKSAFIGCRFICLLLAITPFFRFYMLLVFCFPGRSVLNWKFAHMSNSYVKILLVCQIV